MTIVVTVDGSGRATEVRLVNASTTGAEVKAQLIKKIGRLRTSGMGAPSSAKVTLTWNIVCEGNLCSANEKLPN